MLTYFLGFGATTEVVELRVSNDCEPEGGPISRSDGGHVPRYVLPQSVMHASALVSSEKYRDVRSTWIALASRHC